MVVINILFCRHTLRSSMDFNTVYFLIYSLGYQYINILTGALVKWLTPLPVTSEQTARSSRIHIQFCHLCTCQASILLGVSVT